MDVYVNVFECICRTSRTNRRVIGDTWICMRMCMYVYIGLVNSYCMANVCPPWRAALSSVPPLSLLCPSCVPPSIPALTAPLLRFSSPFPVASPLRTVPSNPHRHHGVFGAEQPIFLFPSFHSFFFPSSRPSGLPPLLVLVLPASFFLLVSSAFIESLLEHGY